MATQNLINIGWGNGLLSNGTKLLPWTNFDLESYLSFGIHLRAISQDLLKIFIWIWIWNVNYKSTLWNCKPLENKMHSLKLWINVYIFINNGITRHDLKATLNNLFLQDQKYNWVGTNISKHFFQAETFDDPCDLSYFHHATLIEKVHISLLGLPQALFGVISQCLPSSVYYTRECAYDETVKLGGRKQIMLDYPMFCDKIHLRKIIDGLIQKGCNSGALAIKWCLLNRPNASTSATKLHFFCIKPSLRLLRL